METMATPSSPRARELLADPKVIITDRVPAPAVQTVTPANPWFPPVPVEPAVKKPVRRLYVFGYASCAPCVSSHPHLLAWLKTAGLPVTVPTAQSECVYIDIQAYPHLAGLWKTEAYPTVIVSDDLKEVARHEGAYTEADLDRLWNTGKTSAHEGPVMAAFAAGVGSDIVLPKVSVNPTTKAVTILETVEIPYGNYVVATLSKGCVMTMGANGLCTFSAPLPQVRTKPVRLDLNLESVTFDMPARTASLRIDGWRKPMVIPF